MKKAIILGITGQDGFYLAELLGRRNINVIGIGRSTKDYLVGDISDRKFIGDTIKREQPDYIFNFAANSTTNHSAIIENHETISTGSLNLLESVYNYSKHTRVFISGSGLQFKNSGLPISELTPFEGRDAYSVSRIHSVFTARYFRQLGVNVYVGYFFNHDSPLRSVRHVNQKIVQAVKRIANGSKEVLELGNINVRKEFSFAGDIVLAVLKLVDNDNLCEAVIGSGQDYPISDWLEECFQYFNLDWHDYVQINRNYVSEYEVLVSDPRLIMSLGWTPKVDMKELARMMIEYN